MQYSDLVTAIQRDADGYLVFGQPLHEGGRETIAPEDDDFADAPKRHGVDELFVAPNVQCLAIESKAQVAVRDDERFATACAWW